MGRHYPKFVPLYLALVLSRLSSSSTTAFHHGQQPSSNRSLSVLYGEKTNKAMAFLKKIGKVGGKSNKDYTFALGVDEGPSGKATASSPSSSHQLQKVTDSYTSCIYSGCIDDLSHPFPTTSCGTEWSGFTDTVMGGVSQASLARETFLGRTANVLRGRVSMLNGGGFVQMACFLHPLQKTVDASAYDGIEVDVVCEAEEPGTLEEEFNVQASLAVPSSDQWKVIRIPWHHFQGKGPGASEEFLDISSLIRVGIVAIGRPMKVVLGVSSIRFYKEEAVR